MAVVATSLLAAIEGYGVGAVFARVSAVRHRVLDRMLDAQYAAKRYVFPALRQPQRVACSIWRVGKNNVVGSGIESHGERQRRLSMDSRQFLRAEGIDVFLEHAQTLWILLHEVGGRCAARERLQTKSAGAGVQIEHARLRNIQLQDAHPGFTNAVERRPDGQATWGADPSPSPAPGDDSQGGWGMGDGGWGG